MIPFYLPWITLGVWQAGCLPVVLSLKSPACEYGGIWHIAGSGTWFFRLWICGTPRRVLRRWCWSLASYCKGQKGLEVLPLGISALGHSKVALVWRQCEQRRNFSWRALLGALCGRDNFSVLPHLRQYCIYLLKKKKCHLFLEGIRNHSNWLTSEWDL